MVDLLSVEVGQFRSMVVDLLEISQSGAGFGGRRVVDASELICRVAGTLCLAARRMRTLGVDISDSTYRSRRVSRVGRLERGELFITNSCGSRITSASRLMGRVGSLDVSGPGRGVAERAGGRAGVRASGRAGRPYPPPACPDDLAVSPACDFDGELMPRVSLRLSSAFEPDAGRVDPEQLVHPPRRRTRPTGRPDHALQQPFRPSSTLEQLAQFSMTTGVVRVHCLVPGGVLGVFCPGKLR